MPQVVLRIGGWEKKEDISPYAYARGEVFVMHLPPIFVAANDRTAPQNGDYRKWLFAFRGETRDGMSVFEYGGFND